MFLGVINKWKNLGREVDVFHFFFSAAICLFARFLGPHFGPLSGRNMDGFQFLGRNLDTADFSGLVWV